MAITTASCTNSEVSSGLSKPATMTTVQATNPCAAKNPCAAAAPIDPTLITRPASTTLFAGTQAQLIQEGERLWNDRSLSTSGLSCQTCHFNHANFSPSFAKPYPHPVAMAQQRAGVQQIALDEMVQFCMVVPMASQPFPWGSKELAALTAYSGQVQKGFIQAAAANPCAAKNPCATKNPCAGR